MLFKTGDIFHCQSNGIIGRAIRKATKSRFNHSAVFIEIWGQAYIMDSQAKGTNLIPFSEWNNKWKYKYFVTRDPFLKDLKYFSMRALSKSGNTGYDFGSLIIRQPLYLLTGKWHQKESKHNNKMYCSEFVAWCHEIHSAYRMSPEDLFNYCHLHQHILIYNNF